ncbi:MAG: hypothetical protein M0030_04595, partial [Actinomycetota bacterium]|nr:hypothetical protein [Actinomycetota bacterium]
MSVQPEDIEPDASGPSGTWQRDARFQWPRRVPWSAQGPEFLRSWGRDEAGRPDPEHLEIIGPTGSGKTYLMCSMLQGRQKARNTGAVLICTKPADGTIAKLGWPIVHKWSDRNPRDRQIVFWPQTNEMGGERRAHHERGITNLLHEL